MVRYLGDLFSDSYCILIFSPIVLLLLLNVEANDLYVVGGPVLQLFPEVVVPDDEGAYTVARSQNRLVLVDRVEKVVEDRRLGRLPVDVVEHVDAQMGGTCTRTRMA